MLRILILANNDMGLYKFRKELIEELLSQGNDVYISLPNGKLVQPLIDMGCKFIDTFVDRRGMNPIKDLRLLLNYLNVLNNVKPDIVVTYTIKPNIYGGIGCRIKQIPYAINITGLGTAFQREGLFKKVIVQLYKLTCRKAKVVFFENTENQNKFISNKILDITRACVLNGAGVNLEEYEFHNYPSNNKELKFLFIGRIMKEKGIDELLAAAKRIKNEYKNVVFDIVGPLEEDYSGELKKLQDQGIVCFHGYQADVKPLIESAHCFILPSYHEGMANTLLESAAMGRPIITSNIHGCKEAVVDKKTGYLVKVKDTEDLYDKIKQFIELPTDSKRNMGYLSREHVAKMFDKREIVKKTVGELLK